MDTICPWTYIGFIRLQKALDKYRAENSESAVKFTLRLAPYQLYPDFSQDGEDKWNWYRANKYNDDETKMQMFSAYMQHLASQDDINLDFHGTTANTLHAHRVLTYIQNHNSPESACKALISLYNSYMADNQHPSSASTLKTACLAAGLSGEESEKVVNDESEEMIETKILIRDQVGNAVDSVPYIVFEGRRRDFTLIGAKEIGEYLKTMGQVEKECK